MGLNLHYFNFRNGRHVRAAGSNLYRFRRTSSSAEFVEHIRSSRPCLLRPIESQRPRNFAAPRAPAVGAAFWRPAPRAPQCPCQPWSQEAQAYCFKLPGLKYGDATETDLLRYINNTQITIIALSQYLGSTFAMGRVTRTVED